MVEVVLSRGVIEPRDLPRLVAAVEAALPAGGEEGVVLSGRMPVWAFAALEHLFHPRPWVGTFDPRLGGCVVVARHRADAPEIGDVVPVTGDRVEVVFE